MKMVEIVVGNMCYSYFLLLSFSLNIIFILALLLKYLVCITSLSPCCKSMRYKVRYKLSNLHFGNEATEA